MGLLITTARASSGTHEEGLNDRSRVISIIDGASLIDLCKKYGVGVKPHYVIDLSSIQEEEVAPPTVRVPEVTTQQILKESLQEDFSRIGTSSIYQSQSKIVIARYSQRYDRPDINYWFGTTAKDLERVQRYRITHFAFICGDRGVVLIPTQTMLEEIRNDNLNKSATIEGQLRHYHIHFNERNHSMFWRLKTENRRIDDLFFTRSQS